MSVVAGDRSESKLEALTFSLELHDMLIDLMQRNFGIKDLEHLVRLHYAYGKENTENYEYFWRLLHNAKDRIDKTAYLMTNNLRAARAIHPKSMAEYDQRRGYQNAAIGNCEQLEKELQRVVERFDVDINVHKRYNNAIYREIDLIKRWRQRDNKIKLYLNKGTA